MIDSYMFLVEFSRSWHSQGERESVAWCANVGHHWCYQLQWASGSVAWNSGAKRRTRKGIWKWQDVLQVKEETTKSFYCLQMKKWYFDFLFLKVFLIRKQRVLVHQQSQEAPVFIVYPLSQYLPVRRRCWEKHRINVLEYTVASTRWYAKNMK